MGVTVLPDWGPQLAAAFSNIGKGVSHIISPDLEFHEKFRDAVAANPKILEDLTDYAYLNNGSLGPLGDKIPRDIAADIHTRALAGNVTPIAIRQRAARDVSNAATPDQLQPP